ncbi:hypothetical protein WN944_014708 [Citrus x changshan-huyou]|uniref:Uncharacterized protein n=1 Tax=Citrus x changshan-huyou TaxID=2935761 RepID=A0AAP0M7L2_9ROSI
MKIEENKQNALSEELKLSSFINKERVYIGITRHDIIAQICYARRLAEKLYHVARMIDLPGGHLVSHERTEEVNQTLIDLIKASEKRISP